MAKKVKADKPKLPLEMKSDERAALQAALAAMNSDKMFGKNAITTLSGDYEMQRFPYQIPTGSLSLDMALGPMCKLPGGIWQTGIPNGRLMEIFGPESSGKTTLTLHIIANAQQMGGTCAFVDAEHALDPSWAQRLGVRTGDLLFSQPQSGEEGLQIVEALVRAKVNVVVCDSVDALVPQAVLDKDIGDSTVGNHAKLMSDGLRKIALLLGNHVHTNVIFTNQLRSKILKPGDRSNPETTPGGRALKFYAHVRVDVRNVGAITVGENESAVRTGQWIQAKVVKNKVSPPFRVADIPLKFESGFDTGVELVDLCKRAGIIMATGTHLYIGERHIGQGAEQAAATIKQNNWQYWLWDQLLTRSLANRGYNPDLTRIPGYVHTEPTTSRQQFLPVVGGAPVEMTEEDIMNAEGQG
jgi:recombination protein RecA